MINIPEKDHGPISQELAGNDEPSAKSDGAPDVNGRLIRPAGCFYGSVTDAFATDRSRPEFREFARWGLNLVYHHTHHRSLRKGKIDLVATALDALKVARLSNHPVRLVHPGHQMPLKCSFPRECEVDRHSLT